MTIEELIRLFNLTRKANKNRWYSLNVVISNDITCQIKAYNTWIQRVTLTSPNGQVIDGSCSDLSVKDINTWLTGTLEYAVNRLKG
jgi:hypothetical protein